LQGKISVLPLIRRFERHDNHAYSTIYELDSLPIERRNFSGRAAEKIALAEE
jgi:hypothetical protein